MKNIIFDNQNDVLNLLVVINSIKKQQFFCSNSTSSQFFHPMNSQSKYSHYGFYRNKHQPQTQNTPNYQFNNHIETRNTLPFDTPYSCCCSCNLISNYKCCCTCCQTICCYPQKSYNNRITLQLSNAIKSSLDQNKQLYNKIQRLTASINLGQSNNPNKVEPIRPQKVIQPLNSKLKNQPSQQQQKDALETPHKHRKHLQLMPKESKESNNEDQIVSQYYGEFMKPKNQKLKSKNQRIKSNRSQNHLRTSMRSLKSANQIYRDSQYRNYKNQKDHLIYTVKLQAKLRQQLINKMKKQNKKNNRSF